MAKTKKHISTISDKEILKEIKNRCSIGGSVNLWEAEAFQAGIEIALKLKKDKKGILNGNYILEGYEWAIEKLTEKGQEF